MNNVNFKRLLEDVKEKKAYMAVVTLVIAMVLATTIISSAVTASGEEAEARKCYDVTLGNKVVATVKTEKEAQNLIKGVEEYYVDSESKVISIKCEPALEYKLHKEKEGEKAPKLMKSKEETIKHLVTGDVEEKFYTIKEGDTVWELSTKLNVPFDEFEKMNPNVDLEGMLIGDKLRYQKSNPLVNVFVEQEQHFNVDIPFETVEKKSAKMTKGSEKIEKYGQYGEEKVTAKVYTKNGETVKTEVLEKEVIKEPVSQIKLVGTKVIPNAPTSRAARNYPAGNGGSVLGVASSYYGTPYSSMDCYAFVSAVYGRFGKSPASGYSIPVSQIRPGDLLIHARHHYAIYAGGGYETHSIRGKGVCTTPFSYVMNYNGPVVAARRIV